MELIKIDNEYYIQEYIQTRGLSKSTEKTLRTVINHYCKYQQQNIHDLLIEADTEEEERIRWKNRQLKKRLINYTNHLKTSMTYNSAKFYIRTVKSFYRHNEIEIGKLPPLNPINARLVQPATYNDLPSHEIIRKAYEVADPLMKVLLLFLSSSGMSKVDALNITINKYIDATKHIHEANNINDALNGMNEKNLNDLIPVWKLRRRKTNKYFITFNTPETTREINNYLLGRMQKKQLTGEDKLFKIHSQHYTVKFERLNDTLNLGKVGNYVRLHGHSLRKFHATQLEKAGMTRYKINFMQGKSENSVDSVYFFVDADELLEDYKKYMYCLSIISKVEVVSVDDADVQKIRRENLRLSERFDLLQREVEQIKRWWK